MKKCIDKLKCGCLMQLLLSDRSKAVYLVVVLLGCAEMLLPLAVVFAADCVAIGERVRKERNLLKKHKLLGQVIQECAGDSTINYYYAYTHERLERYGNALKYYMAASAIEPGNAAYFFGMGDVYVMLEREEAALHAYELGIELDSGNKRALRKLNDLRVQQTSQAEYMVTPEKAVAMLAPDDVQPYTAQSIEGPLLSIHIPYKRSSPLLSVEAKSLLDIVGWTLRDESLRGACFEVVGHTDSSGNKEGNMVLSRYRAETVKNYLVQMHQIDENRLRVVSLGERQPIVPNTTVANKVRNRRVEFRRVDQQ